MQVFMNFKNPTWEDKDLENIHFLTALCRLRYSELNDHFCVIDDGVEGASNGQTNLDHQLDVEFTEMMFYFHQLKENGHHFLTDPKPYTDLLTVLVKALYGYHLLFDYKPIYNYKIQWPVACCLDQKVTNKQEVSLSLKAAVDAGNTYLKNGNYKKINKSLVKMTDWISFDPII